MGVSLNYQLLVGPMVHAQLPDVLLRFRHKIALVTDISRMYHAVLLPFGEVKDFRMMRLKFGVSASSFAANMALKHNAILDEQSHPQAASAIHNSFYVDDGFTGARSIPEAIKLQKELQEMLRRGAFLL